jgi:hypothetical protein
MQRSRILSTGAVALALIGTAVAQDGGGADEAAAAGAAAFPRH